MASALFVRRLLFCYRLVVKIPLHLRYQATGSTPYTTIVLPTPQLLVKTSPDDQEVEKVVSLPCSPSSASSSWCYWYLLPWKPSQTELIATVPIGQIGHTTLVTIATVSLTFGTILYLMHSIMHNNITRMKND